MDPFKCMWATEPVTDCPPVKELNRLRADVKRLETENRMLEEENRELRERVTTPQALRASSPDKGSRAVEGAGPYKSNFGEVMTTI